MSSTFSRYDAIEEKFEKLFEFASEHPEFDTEFIDSVYKYFEENNDVSDRQFQALDRVIEKWGID